MVFLGWNAPTEIKLIHELTFLLASNPLNMLMQKLLKSMINSDIPRYNQPSEQFLLWFIVYMRLNSRVNRGLV